MTTILLPGESAYDEARAVFNSMIDGHPARIVRCRLVTDVADAVRAARADGLTVSVYGGGHSVKGDAVADGAVCVDLRELNSVRVDAEARTATVGGGARWSDVDAATQQHGLAVTGGRVPTTGVGGLALGSGSGWLERKLGFTCDNLLSAQVVTAAGEIVTTSESENADLFWAIRGGGGNFGIVTRFTFRLSPIGPIVLGGMLAYPPTMAGAVLRNFRDVMSTAPDEVGGAVALITAPDAPFVPEPARGKPMVGVIVCHAGDVEEGRAVLAPILEFGPPAVDLVGPMPYVAMQQLIAPGNPSGMRNYWSADFYDEFSDGLIDALVAHAIGAPSPLTQIIVVAGGGAPSRVAEEATAFGSRDMAVNVHYLGMWPPTGDVDADRAADAENIAWIKRASGALKPFSNGQVYLNFIGDEGKERVRTAFAPEKYARLRRIKAEWDPDNVFRHNQNIPPAA